MMIDHESCMAEGLIDGLIDYRSRGLYCRRRVGVGGKGGGGMFVVTIIVMTNNYLDLL